MAGVGVMVLSLVAGLPGLTEGRLGGRHGQLEGVPAAVAGAGLILVGAVTGIGCLVASWNGRAGGPGQRPEGEGDG